MAHWLIIKICSTIMTVARYMFKKLSLPKKHLVSDTAALQRLFITQEKAVQMVCSYSPSFVNFCVLTTEELHKLQLACLCSKFIKALHCHIFSDVLCINTHNTRRANDYHIAVHWTHYLLKHTIYTAGPLLWNWLDCNIKSAISIYNFRRRLKRYC